MPEELEKHMTLHSNGLRIFEDARLEIVTHMEAKFGLRIRDSKPSETGARGHSDPMDVDATNSLAFGKGEGSSSPRGGCFRCGGARFPRDCNVHANLTQRQWQERWAGKGKSNEGKGDGKSKGKSQGSKSEVCARVELRPKSGRGSETQESGQTWHTDNAYTNNSWFDGGWSCDEWNDDWCSVGWHEGWKQTNDNVASSVSLVSFDLGAMSIPNRFEWKKMNLDTGAALNTCPLNFGPDGAGDGIFYRTASGECIQEGGV